MEKKAANRPKAAQRKIAPPPRTLAKRIAERVDKKCGRGYVPPSEMTVPDLSSVATHLYRISPAKTCPIKELKSFVSVIQDICTDIPSGRRPQKEELAILETLAHACVLRRVGVVPFSVKEWHAEDFIAKCVKKLESGEAARPDRDAFSRNIRWTSFLIDEYLRNDRLFEGFNPAVNKSPTPPKKKHAANPVAHLTPPGLKRFQAAFAALAAARLRDTRRFLKEGDRPAVVVALEDAVNALEIVLSLRARRRPVEEAKDPGRPRGSCGKFDPFFIGSPSDTNGDASTSDIEESHLGILRYYPKWSGRHIRAEISERWFPGEGRRALASSEKVKARHSRNRDQVLSHHAITAKAVDLWRKRVDSSLDEVAKEVANFFDHTDRELGEPHKKLARMFDQPAIRARLAGFWTSGDGEPHGEEAKEPADSMKAGDCGPAEEATEDRAKVTGSWAAQRAAEAAENEARRNEAFAVYCAAVAAKEAEVWREGVGRPRHEVVRIVSAFFGTEEVVFARFLCKYCAMFRMEPLDSFAVSEGGREPDEEEQGGEKERQEEAQILAATKWSDFEAYKIAGGIRTELNDNKSDNKYARIWSYLDDHAHELRGEITTVLEYLSELAPGKIQRGGLRSILAPPAHVSDILKRDGIPFLFPSSREGFIRCMQGCARTLAIMAQRLAKSGEAKDGERLLNSALLKKRDDDYHTTFNWCLSAAATQCSSSTGDDTKALGDAGEESEIAVMVLGWAKKLSKEQIDPFFWQRPEVTAAQEGSAHPRRKGAGARCPIAVARLRVAADFLIEECFAAFLDEIAKDAGKQLALLRSMISKNGWPRRNEPGHPAKGTTTR